jgi:two-component system, NtrC family, sensor kinase
MGMTLTAKLRLALATGALAGIAAAALVSSLVTGAATGLVTVSVGVVVGALVSYVLLLVFVRRRAVSLRTHAEQMVARAPRGTLLREPDDLAAAAHALSTLSGQLEELRAQLVQSEKLAAFGQLGAGITHEVKNPITALVGFAQLAQRRLDDPAKVTELLKIIEAEALRCRDLLGSFLSFARSSSSAWDRVEVNALVEEAARLLKHQLSIHGVDIVFELGPDVPAISGSATELKQIIMNLCFNAQQAMPKGGTVWIATALADDGMAVIEVRDNGPGIPPNIRDKIFDPFFTTKKPGEGTGLGLAVSQGIARAHKGSLTVESKDGKGASFYLRLPPAPALGVETAATGT